VLVLLAWLLLTRSPLAIVLTAAAMLLVFLGGNMVTSVAIAGTIAVLGGPLALMIFGVVVVVLMSRPRRRAER
jgi:hypothetical protein